MQQQHLFRFNILCLSLMTALPAYAENVQAGQAQEKQLDTIQVKAKKQKTRRDNEVTGLGKLVKTADTLSKEQVLDIRDLTRYDPGIAVVEQGRGASSGYSIRGMDKNRVSLTVDGLAQIQSYTAQAALGGTRTAGSSGAINEIEYENVKAVEISKGSNSVEQGSGALAGSVAFQTKTADDVIGEGRQWGIQSKTAYSGKNRGLTQSIALAGRIGGAEALLIRTGTRGKSAPTKPPDAAFRASTGWRRLMTRAHTPISSLKQNAKTGVMKRVKRDRKKMLPAKTNVKRFLPETTPTASSPIRFHTKAGRGCSARVFVLKTNGTTSAAYSNARNKLSTRAI